MRTAFLWLIGAAVCAGQVNSSSQIGVARPVFQKYSVVAIADTVNGCANANGCWQVNGVLGANKAAALTQSVTLFALPANGFVNGPARIKTATACTGTSTLVTRLGTTADTDFYLTAAYDLKLAVSNTNLTTAPMALVGADTAAATNVVAALTSTVNNIDQIVAGCAFDVWLQWTALP